MSEISLRTLHKRDLPFVTNSWLKNYRKSWHVKGVPNEIYFARHHRVLEHLIPRASTIVACHPEDPDVLFGWACAEIINDAFVLHYIYIKQRFKTVFESGEKVQGFGMGTALLETFLENEAPSSLYHSHETKAGKEFLKRLYQKDVIPEPIYDPYLIYETLPEGWSY